MGGPDTSMGGPERQFPSTLWTDILAAQEGDAAKLERLLRIYWKPVYAYIRTVGRRSIEDTKDLTQAFFSRLLEKNYFAQLRPERGSFRGFLKISAKRFLINAAEHERVRRPDRPVFPLDVARDELDRLGTGAAGEDPDRVFDREWFRQLLEEATEELRALLETDGKRVYFDVFRAYCIDSARPGGETPTYAQLGAGLGIAETDVRNYLSYARRALREILVRRVRDYVESDADVERELGEAAGS